MDILNFIALALGYALLMFCTVRILIALLVLRHMFHVTYYKDHGEQIKIGRARFYFFCAIGLFFKALVDTKDFDQFGRKVIWWNGFKSGIRWESIKEFYDEENEFWCKQIADGAALGRTAFEFRGTKPVFISANSDDIMAGEFVEKPRSVFVDKRHVPMQCVGPNAAGEAIVMNAYGPFDWLNGKDNDFIRFLLNHFQCIVCIRNVEGDVQYPFGSLNCEPTEIDGMTYYAFGVEAFYSDYEADDEPA